MDNLYVGQTVYFSRIIPTGDVYDLIDLKIRTVDKDAKWFVGVDKKTRAAFLFHELDIDNIIFFDRKNALNKVKEAERSRKVKVEVKDCLEDS